MPPQMGRTTTESPTLMAESRSLQVLVVDAGGSLPTGVVDLTERNGWRVTSAADYRTAIDAVQRGPIDAVLLSEPAVTACGTTDHREYTELVQLVQGRHIAAILLTDNPVPSAVQPVGLVESVRRNISLDELRGRLATIERYHIVLRRMEQELHKMERISQRLNRHFEQVDQEMSLAGRLQRDFLPRGALSFGNVRFSTVYRPASWVSGDMFDIVRINDRQIGVYVADAVGHGMAAGLLTMFIKRATVPKRIENGREIVLSPSEVVSALNDALVDQGLPSCQFVTAGYSVLDQQTMTLRWAGGGHPYPIWIRATGEIEEIQSSGGLLGIFKGEEFPSAEVQLSPGDKVLFYTDGVELGFQSKSDDSFDTQMYRSVFRELAGAPIEEMLSEIVRRLDNETGSLDPKDDVTIVGMEVTSA